MKYIPFLYALLLLGTFSSCSDDNSPAAPNMDLQKEPPLSFALLTVPDGSQEVDLNPTLSWESAKNPEGNELSYALYVGTDLDPSTLIQGNISGTAFEMEEDLEHLTTYYWKVIATDSEGQTSQSPIGSFTTRFYRFPDVPVNEEAPFDARTSHQVLEHNERLWFIAGFKSGLRYNDVWYSTDGVEWENATAAASFSKRAGHTSLSFDEKLWVIGGSENGVDGQSDVWYSEDGTIWNSATLNANFPKRTGHSSVVFDNKMWVIGGYDNGTSKKSDVWYSEDGVNWTLANGIPPFTQRSSHASVVFDNKIWVIGGAANGRKNDVWHSTNGVDWISATDNAAFSPRNSHDLIVFDNKIWLIGGFDGSKSYSDVWYTENGVDWIEAVESSPIGKRSGHSLAFFDNTIWLVGGNVSGEGLKNDVWKME